MQRLKIMTIVGTRPEIIKLSRVIAELEKHTQHILVHTGQNFDYELNEIFFNDLEVKKPDYFLHSAKGNAAETIGQVIINADKVLEKEMPEAVLIYGDTNSCLAVIAAKRRKIPIFHMEAGNRCFDQRVPEEINRKIIDHISDINLTISEHARHYLIAEGLPPETTFKVGSSMQEVFTYYGQNIASSTILEKLKLTANDYLLVSLHREENVDAPENIFQLINLLNKLVERYDKEIVFSTHPRTRMRLDAFQTSQESVIHPRVRFLKPFGFFDYIKLQLKAFCVLSDSGSLTEDSSIMNFPGVALRESHERPEGMDEGTVVMSGLSLERVIQAIDLVTSQQNRQQRNISMVTDYQADNVSLKVIRIILSYINYINRTVWYKSTSDNSHLVQRSEMMEQQHTIREISL